MEAVAAAGMVAMEVKERSLELAAEEAMEVRAEMVLQSQAAEAAAIATMVKRDRRKLGAAEEDTPEVMEPAEVPMLQEQKA